MNLIAVLILLISTQAFSYQSPFSATWEQGTIKIGAGQEIKTDILIGVPEGHFLYKDKTDLSFTALSGMRIKSVTYPAGVSHKDPVTGQDVSIYPAGEVIISVVFFAPTSLREGAKNVNALLEFQGCGEKLCLRPESYTIDWTLEITRGVAAMHEDYDLAVKSGTRNFRDVVSRGRLLAMLAAFVAGILTSFTPCVWPLIPVLLLIIGIHRRGRFLNNLALSFMLCLGIAVTYAVLGIIASVAGHQIGFLFQRKIFLALVVVFLFLMSLSMFGLFSIRLPVSLQNFLSKVGGKGHRGAFLSGMSLGLLATPCTGPLLGPMLIWVASEKEYLFGGGLLAVYAMGIGVAYIVVGTFYGTLAGRIKSVKVGLIVKKILGVLLLVPALYYLNSLVPLNGWGKHNINWRHDEQTAIVEAVTGHKPLMIVFGARWCPPCVELEKKVFDTSAFAMLAEGVVPLYIDATLEADEVRRVLDKYNVVGWPTILFVSSGGKVYDDLSIVGDVPTVTTLMMAVEEAVKREKGD